MAYTLNGVNIRQGLMNLPHLGAWHMECALDATQVPPVGPATLVIGTQTWTGTIFRAAAFAGTVSARVIGGSSGLDNTLKPKSYRNATVKQVAADILAQVGETLSPKSVAEDMNTTLQFWSVGTETAGIALKRLCDRLNARRGRNVVLYYVQQDGSVFLGADPETPVTTEADDVQIVNYHVNELAYEVAMLSPTLIPHTMWNGKSIDSVNLELHPDGLRGMVYFSEVAS